MAIHTAERVGNFAGIHPFQQATNGLKISVATADVAQVVDFSVHKVEIYLLAAYHVARAGTDVSHTTEAAVGNNFVVVPYHFRVSLKKSLTSLPHSSASTPPSTSVFG